MEFKKSIFAFSALCLVAGSAKAVEIKLSRGLSNSAEAKHFITALKLNKEIVLSASDEDQLSVGPSPDLTTVIASPSWDRHYQAANKNGDIYILWGNLGTAWTEQEYRQFYSISKWLVSHHFRNIINPMASEEDLREAVSNPRTSGILWSSHGAEDGQIFDVAGNPISKDVFSKDISPSFRHMVMSNCYSDQSIRYYEIPQQLVVHHWTGLTTTEEFFSYLKSNQWDADLQTDLGILF